MMPQSARIVTTACPKPAVSLEDRQKEFDRVTRSASPQRARYTQGRRRSHPSVRCRDLGSLSEADQATGAVSPTLLALHSWHQMARPRVERRSPQESQPAQHRVHFLQVQLRWAGHVTKIYACPEQSSSARSKKKSAIVVLQESVTKIS